MLLNSIPTIKYIIEELKDFNIALIGTSNMAIQGINIYPKDIDFLTDDNNIQEIAKKFNAKIKEDHGYKEVEVKINNIAPVHFVSNTTNPLRMEGLDKKIIVEKSGISVPCMPLERELDFYSKLDKETAKNKVRLIRQHLRK